MKLAAGLLLLALVGCTTTKVVVVTVVTKTSQGDLQPSNDYYEGVMDKEQIKKLLNDTIDGDAEKPKD